MFGHFAKASRSSRRKSRSAVSCSRAARQQLTTSGDRRSSSASIALARTAKTQALLSGRDFVVPDDVKAVAAPVLRHRLRLGVDAELEGQTVESVLAQLLEQVEAPRR